jgi:DNA repair exonuclease SbcCD nuclease subunit
VVRFVHTADWQLGMRRHYLDADAHGRFNQGRLDAIAAIGRLAAEEDADFVVVAGDVFDDNQVDRRTVLRALEVLRGFPDVPVLLLPGNHDPANTGSVLAGEELQAGCPANVRVVTDATPIAVAPGVEVVGAPWRTRRPVANPAADVLAGLEPAPPGTTRVLLAHGGLDEAGGAFDQPGLLRLADLEAALDDGRVHYVALGDRHSTDGYGRDARIWYAGAPEPTSYVEHDPGNALLVDLTPAEVTVSRRRVGRWSFRQAVLDVAGPEDVAAVARWLDEPDDKPHTCAKLALRGTVSLADRRAIDDLLERAGQTYAALERWERHEALATAPSEADLEALRVGGFVAAALEELRATVADAGPAAGGGAAGHGVAADGVAADEAAADEAAGHGAADAAARTASDALALLYRTVVRA